LSARFTGAESVLNNVRVLQKTNWPEAEKKRILYGDREVLELTKMVKVDAHYISAVVRQFRMVKDGREEASGDNQWKEFRRLAVLFSEYLMQCSGVG